MYRLIQCFVFYCLLFNLQATDHTLRVIAYWIKHKTKHTHTHTHTHITEVHSLQNTRSIQRKYHLQNSPRVATMQLAKVQRIVNSTWWMHRPIFRFLSIVVRNQFRLIVQPAVRLLSAAILNHLRFILVPATKQNQLRNCRRQFHKISAQCDVNNNLL